LNRQRIEEIGEQGLLKRLQAFCPVDMVGDDAAVLTIHPEKRLVVTTDMLVDGVHFSDRTTRPEDAGWRAAAANLSDLAAMGATPLGITVALGLPGSLEVEWVERLYRGITDCLHPFNTIILGGDLVRSPKITISITALGEVHPEQLICRSAAQPNWAIVATGDHGASRAGLELLLHPEQGVDLKVSDRDFLIYAHQRPQPRFDVLPILDRAEKSTATGSGQTAASRAGMDSSDGLADAVLQICRASGVGARLQRSQIPMPPALANWLPHQCLQWALFGGEDFELVLCLPMDTAQKLVDQLGGSAAMIGITTVEPEVWLVDSSGRYPNEQLSLEQGFQHFS
jgi:thiamine-monophosphate kinase